MSYMLIVFLGQIFGPTLAAVAMTGVTEGKPGLRRFLGRTVRWHVGIQWYLFVLIGIPVIESLGTIVLPRIWQSFKPFENATSELLNYVVFYVYPALLIGGPLFEEPGWRGFAQPRLQERFGANGGEPHSWNPLGLLAFADLVQRPVDGAQYSQHRLLRLLD
jgi:membrane protease YdiL (CAAX protease family)